MCVLQAKDGDSTTLPDVLTARTTGQLTRGNAHRVRSNATATASSIPQ